MQAGYTVEGCSGLKPRILVGGRASWRGTTMTVRSPYKRFSFYRLAFVLKPVGHSLEFPVFFYQDLSETA